MAIKIFILCFLLIGCSSKSWRDASRDSVGIAKPAQEQTEDIIQVYYARAYSWKGYFGVHPWVAWKKKNDESYTVAQVTSWNLRRSSSTVSVKSDLPDRKWFDSEPTLLFQLEGKKALKAINKVQELIKRYPYTDSYKVWPGPNSNTFVAYLIRHTPELALELPPHAVGKDYLEPSTFFAKSASSTGFQVSLFGLLGLTLGAGEGIELNLLGLNFGLDLWSPAIKLPFLGRLGFPDKEI